MFGAAAMSLSSIFVVTNALRLNVMRVFDTKKRRSGISADIGAVVREIAVDICKTEKESNTILNEKEGGNMMEKTFDVKGMMCVHCKAHVEKALMAVDGVASAEADVEKGVAVVQLEKDVDGSVLAKAITDAGYEVL